MSIATTSPNEAAAAPGELAPGDLVVLRSGGPVLTIASVAGAQAHCIWFSGEDVLQRAEIPLSCLDPADEADGIMSEISYSEADFDTDMHEDGEDDDRDGKKKKKKKKHNED